ncbi:MAG: 1,4-dihydroxy-2-naphthoate polyprenyltransferase [Propionibacteriaceae bacterium]
MATLSQWVEGARPRTLPAAVAPIVAGTGVAFFVHRVDLVRAVLALVVALALQIGVNFANDYSDGIRGTDANRVGPLRLTGLGLAKPKQVKLAAFSCFGAGAAAGFVLVALTGHWWLLGIGAAAILAAWFYTGGKHPYGYAGLGEVFVFVFFGLVAVAGTTYVQCDEVPISAWCVAVAIGSLACLILVANNLRDRVGDLASGKRTLATRLGDRGTRWFFLLLMVIAIAAVIAAAVASTWWAMLGLAFVVLVFSPTRAVLAGVHGRDLIAVLKTIGIAELVCACGLAIGMAIGG